MNNTEEILRAEEQERQHEEDLKRCQELRLMDDDFMTTVFAGQKEAVSRLVSIILDRKDLTVVQILDQKYVNDLTSRLYVVVEEADGLRSYIVIQREDRDHIAHRARYMLELLDKILMESGCEYNMLPDRYVILITEADVWKEDRPIYRFATMDLDDHTLLDDGQHFIYVNGAYRNDSDDIHKV